MSEAKGTYCIFAGFRLTGVRGKRCERTQGYGDDEKKGVRLRDWKLPRMGTR